MAAHVDAFSGETPFQAVQWLPLVDVFETKAMFLLPPAKYRELIPRLRDIMERGSGEAVFDAIRDDVIWVPVPYGQVMIFSPNLLHGNVINETGTTRWSMNRRSSRMRAMMRRRSVTPAILRCSCCRHQ